ncbi:hypothetical protein [Lysinibacillus sp. SGAir0095]|uniref:hypothetical protein n=1 Tax=Lysinibacillus sp. SGAir0095 TaxID=2070463 RepID=UPI00143E07B7|nr:hypothetical protein [Lysinibacillus sp. SGAir0095]
MPNIPNRIHIKWNRLFEKESKPKILNMLQRDEVNSVIVKNIIELDNYLKNI